MTDTTSPVPTPNEPNPQSPPLVTPQYPDAFKRALPAATALSAGELVTVNIDIPSAMTIAIGKLPEILAMRDQIIAELPKFDISALDLLETYTLATGYSHAMYLAASAPPEALAKLTSMGVELRDTLYSDAVALANRSLINGDRLGDFRNVPGYKNLAFDLLGLAALLRQNWSQIAGKTALQASELDQAEVLGEQLVNAVGAREQAPTVAAEVTQQRQRTFTLFVKTYDQVRRAIGYLRWNENDADDIAPSLYAGRTTRKKTDTNGTTTATGIPTAPSAPNMPSGGATPSAPGAPAPSPTNKAPTAAAIAAPGLPGSSPFSG